MHQSWLSLQHLRERTMSQKTHNNRRRETFAYVQVVTTWFEENSCVPTTRTFWTGFLHLVVTYSTHFTTCCSCWLKWLSIPSCPPSQQVKKFPSWPPRAGHLVDSARQIKIKDPNELMCFRRRWHGSRHHDLLCAAQKEASLIKGKSREQNPSLVSVVGLVQFSRKISAHWVSNVDMIRCRHRQHWGWLSHFLPNCTPYRESTCWYYRIELMLRMQEHCSPSVFV